MTDAIVIGAGPVGLATAMLLAARDIDVTVLERDDPPPDGPRDAWESWERRSVTQFHQVHFLQAGGRAVLEARLPAVVDELRAVGAVRWNMIAGLGRLLPDGPVTDGFEQFETITTCRRPVLELAFAKAAAGTPRVCVRHNVTVSELTVGTAVLANVPHVTGVRTSTGETFGADIVIDAAGRRSPVGRMLADLGGPAPDQRAEEFGFVYNTQLYRGDALPELGGDALAALGSISVLTMPGDDGHWAVTLYHLPQDKQMRKVRDPAVFERVVRSLPLHAHWADGQRIGTVATMASTTNSSRSFVRNDGPVATGLVPVGDAWGFTNPSLGRGITLGLLHAVDVADVVADEISDPAALARRWAKVTEERAAQWHEATVQFDRIRGPEAEAALLGLDDPHDPADLSVAGFRAFDSARHYDAEVLRWFGEQASCISLPMEVASRPGVFARVLEVASHNPPYRTPAPSRTELEALLA